MRSVMGMGVRRNYKLSVTMQRDGPERATLPQCRPLSVAGAVPGWIPTSFRFNGKRLRPAPGLLQSALVR